MKSFWTHQEWVSDITRSHYLDWLILTPHVDLPQLWPRLRRINCNIVLQSFWLVLWWMLEACHYSLSDISDDITGGPLLHCYTVNSLSPPQCPSSPLTLITTAVIRTVSFLLRSVANPPDSQNLLAFSQSVTSCWVSQHVESHMLIITCWAWACWVFFTKVERDLFLSSSKCERSDELMGNSFSSEALKCKRHSYIVNCRHN